MRNLDTTSKRTRLVILCAMLVALAALPLLSSARSANSNSINIVNNSAREIRHVYLAPVGGDTWSENQLGDSVIAPGQSRTVNNSACDQQQIKVIGEDQNGCFLSTVVACGGDATWTITNDTAADCGQ
ncbi:MAG: hypothetical protein ND895_13880 [Pyrinomonadaceae bacterium]|nr:hypothetical protein [Pyrinomonadaceae bacterium]